MKSVYSVVKRAELGLLSLYLRHCRWERGRWRVSRRAATIAEKALTCGGRRTVRTHGGFRINVNLDDWLGRRVYTTGQYEAGTTTVIKSLTKPGATVVDVGANIGYFTLLASRCVGVTGKVISCEPVPDVCQRLRANLVLNRMDNVKIHDVAISNHTGEVMFYVGANGHVGTSSLRELSNASRCIHVRQMRLDEIIDENWNIDLVKIDVEGAEWHVLDGMGRLLRCGRPDVVAEVTDSYLRGMGKSAKSLCNMMVDIGYRMYVIDYDGLVPIDGLDVALPAQCNVLFTVRSTLPKSLRIKTRVAA